MRNDPADFDEIVARWLFDNSGDQQRCRDMVQQLMDMELLVRRDMDEETYSLLLGGRNLDYALLRTPAKGHGGSFLSKLRGWEQKSEPDKPIKKQPPEFTPSSEPPVQRQEVPSSDAARENDRRRIAELEAQLQAQRENAQRLEEKIAQLEAQLPRKQQELEDQFAQKKQELAEAFRRREQELADRAIYAPADAHSLITAANESRDRAFELTQKILSESARFRQEQERLLLEFRISMAGACNNAGLEKLAELYGRMVHSKTPEAQAYLWSLKNIMTAFGMRPFRPLKGDAFDPREHEPKIIGQFGSHVAECYSEGWKLGDEVVTRAVVETEDE